MDWATVALITYGFLLALVLALIVVLGQRHTKKRYTLILEEREQKIARLQIELDDTMQALESYSEELRKEWAGMQKQEQEVMLFLHKRYLEIDAMLRVVDARLNSLETGHKTLIKTAFDTSVKEKETLLDVPLQEDNASPAEEQAEQQESCDQTIEKENIETVMDKIDDRMEAARKLLEKGNDIMKVARELELSRAEMELLDIKLQRKYV